MTAAPGDEGEDRPSLEGLPPVPGHPPGSTEANTVRANRALELRMAGANYAQIATALEYADAGAACAAVQRALRADLNRVADIREEYRTLQLVRTERLLRGIWPKALAGDGPMYDRALRTMERQAKLLGLDAPVQVSVTDDTRLRITAMLDDLEGRIVQGEVVQSSEDGLGGEDGSRTYNDDDLGF